MDPLQLSIYFLLGKNFAMQQQVEDIVSQDIDGVILLGMLVDQLEFHVGFSFGKATNILVRWLEMNATSSTIYSRSTCTYTYKRVNHVLHMCSWVLWELYNRPCVMRELYIFPRENVYLTILALVGQNFPL